MWEEQLPAGTHLPPLPQQESEPRWAAPPAPHQPDCPPGGQPRRPTCHMPTTQLPSRHRAPGSSNVPRSPHCHSHPGPCPRQVGPCQLLTAPAPPSAAPGMGWGPSASACGRASAVLFPETRVRLRAPSWWRWGVHGRRAHRAACLDHPPAGSPPWNSREAGGDPRPLTSRDGSQEAEWGLAWRGQAAHGPRGASLCSCILPSLLQPPGHRSPTPSTSAVAPSSRQSKALGQHQVSLASPSAKPPLEGGPQLCSPATVGGCNVGWVTRGQ